MSRVEFLDLSLLALEFLVQLPPRGRQIRAVGSGQLAKPLQDGSGIRSGDFFQNLLAE